MSMSWFAGLILTYVVILIVRRRRPGETFEDIGDGIILTLIGWVVFTVLWILVMAWIQ